MANRLFKTEPQVDMYINEKTKNKSATVAQICNNGIYYGYLPQFSMVLKTEAHALLQMENVGQQEIRQSLYRGVDWLGDYHIKKSDILQYILSHYTGTIFDRPEMREDNRANATMEIMRDAYYRLKDLCPEEPIYETIDPVSLSEQILSCWSKVYDEKIMYKVISLAIYLSENSREFSRGEAVDILKEIENEVIREHISQEKLNADKAKEAKLLEKLCWLLDKAQHGIQIEKVYSMGGVVNVELSDSSKNFKINSYDGFYDLLDMLCDNVNRRDLIGANNREVAE